MAVTPGYVASAAITWTASATATASGASIGTASAGRIVIVGVTVEDDVTFSTCTIGGIAATLAVGARDTGGTPDNAAAIFYANVPTGTTANIVVTVSGSITQTGRISVWATTGAQLPHTGSNSATGSAVSINLAGITIKPNGAAYYVFNNATTATAVTWTSATERDDTSVANYRHSNADTTTAGTPTVNADGATANQVIVGMALDALEPTAAWDHVPTNGRKASIAKVGLALIAASGVVMPIPPPIPVATTVPAIGWLQPSPYPVSTTLTYQDVVYCPAPPIAAPADNTAPGVGWASPAPYVVSTSLYYQSRFEGILPPVSVSNTITGTGYVQQTSRAPQKTWPPKAASELKQFAVPDGTTPQGWQQQFTRALARTPLPLAQPAFVSQPVAAPSNTTNTLWPLAQGEKARPVRRPAPQGYWAFGYPYAAAPPPDAVQYTGFTVTGAQVFTRTLNYQDAAYCPQPPTAAPPVVDTVAWLVKWDRPPRGLLPLPGGRAYVPAPGVAPTVAWQLQGVAVRRARVAPQGHHLAVLPPVVTPSNTTNTLWPLAQGEKARPVARVAPQGGSPFIPSAVLAPPPDAIQFAGFTVTGAQVFNRTLNYQDTAWSPYPVVVPSNNIVGTGWYQQFTPAVARRPFAWTQSGYVPGEPLILGIGWQVTSSYVRTTTLFYGDVAYVPPPPPAVDNNITGMGWHQPFPLVPYRSLAWTKTPPVNIPVGFQNTITGMGWFQPFRGPPRVLPRHTPPYFDATFIANPSNTITGMAWHQPFPRMPRVKPRYTTPLFDARFIASPSNTIVGMAWHQPLGRMPRVKPRYSNVTYTAPPRLEVVYAQNVDADVTVTVEFHICGWGTETEAADGFIVQAEGSDPWSEQAESDDDYDEKDECGR